MAPAGPRALRVSPGKETVMASKDPKDVAAQARKDQRQAERDQRMRTGKAVKIAPSKGWIKSKAPHN